MATHDDATRPDEPRRAWVTDGSADIEDLQIDPRNANRGTPRGRALLESSLREYGAGRAVLTDRDGVLIAGNKTFEVAQRLGIPTRVIETDGQELVVVSRRDLHLASDPKARALAIADNRVGELDLDWDPAILQQLQADGLDLGLFWTPEEFERLLGEGTHAGQTDENAVVTPGATDIVRGDLFALGRHRLLCGDATDPADVHHLLAGQVPGLMVTDPPYGVAYDPAWRHRMDPRQRTAVGRVANDDRVDWRAAFVLFGGDVAYVWHAGLFAGPVAAALQSSGFALRSQIIWVKQHFALSRGEMHWAHEPCWYAVRKGRPSHWQGDRRQTTVWDVPNLNPFGGSRDGENAVSGHGTPEARPAVGATDSPPHHHVRHPLRSVLRQRDRGDRGGKNGADVRRHGSGPAVHPRHPYALGSVHRPARAPPTRPAAGDRRIRCVTARTRRRAHRAGPPVGGRAAPSRGA